MATNFPGALDDGTILESNRVNTSLTVNDHATQHNNLSDAVKAVETELGTNPKGTYTDVKTRLTDAVVKTPTAAQVIAPGGDYTGIVVKANVALATANIYEGRDNLGNIKFFVDKNFKVSSQGYQVNGVALQASDLSNGVTGTGSVVLASAPTLTGVPVAPTAAPGTSTTQLATTAFVAAAIGAAPGGTSGTLASIPAASTKPSSFYYATDQAVLFFSDGVNWIRMSVPAGATVDWFQPGSTVPTGWVAYDGSTLPGSTGIYADLFAHLGSTTTLPDTRGRVTVAKGTHTDVGTIGGNDGLTVGNRRPKHKHTVNDPTHAHDARFNTSGASSPWPKPADFGSVISGSVPTSSVATGITIGPQTGAEPTDSSAYIVCMKIAKL